MTLGCEEDGRSYCGRKKSRRHTSTCARLSIVEITTTLWRIHWAPHFVSSLKALYFREAILIETIIPLSKKLSIIFVRCPRNTIELMSRIKSLSLDGRGLRWWWIPLPVTLSRQGRDNYKDFCDWLYLIIMLCSVCGKISGDRLGEERKQEIKWRSHLNW